MKQESILLMQCITLLYSQKVCENEQEIVTRVEQLVCLAMTVVVEEVVKLCGTLYTTEFWNRAGLSVAAHNFVFLLFNSLNCGNNGDGIYCIALLPIKGSAL